MDETDNVAKIGRQVGEAGSVEKSLGVASIYFTLSCREMVRSIDRFNRQTKKQNSIMITLTVVIAVLTVAIAVLTGVLVYDARF